MTTNHDQLMKELIGAFPDQFLVLAAPEIAEQVHLEGLVFEPEEHYSGSRTGYARRGDLISSRDLALRLLGQRFGDLSAEARRRVAGIASAEELSQLVERVYQAESLEELGLA